MDLKRALTERIRLRRSNAPSSIDLPSRNSSSSGTKKSIISLGTPQTPTNLTPTTPSIEEFASIEFEQSSSSSISPHYSHTSSSLRNGSPSQYFAPSTNSPIAQSSPSQSSYASSPAGNRPGRSTRSSRSASLISVTEKLRPALSLSVSDRNLVASRGRDGSNASSEPMSPDSMNIYNDETEADEIAQKILEKVQEGGQNWSL